MTNRISDEYISLDRADQRMGKYAKTAASMLLHYGALEGEPGRKDGVYASSVRRFMSMCEGDLPGLIEVLARCTKRDFDDVARQFILTLNAAVVSGPITYPSRKEELLATRTTTALLRQRAWEDLGSRTELGGWQCVYWDSMPKNDRNAMTDWISTHWSRAVLTAALDALETQNAYVSTVAAAAGERFRLPSPEEVTAQIRRLGEPRIEAVVTAGNGEAQFKYADEEWDTMWGHPIHALQWVIPPSNEYLGHIDGTTGVVPVTIEGGDVALLLSTFRKGKFYLRWAVFPDADPDVSGEVSDWLDRFELRS